MEQQQTERGAAFQVCAQSQITSRNSGQDLHLSGQALVFAPHMVCMGWHVREAEVNSDPDENKDKGCREKKCKRKMLQEHKT